MPFLFFIKDHKDFYQIALKNRKEFPIKEGLDAIWTEVVIPYSLEANLTNEKEMMFYWIGFQAGLTMIIKYWLDTGCMENEEQVAKMIHNCVPSIWKINCQ
ncbi:TetR-like C-terminal domain-containing protein [Floccifex sp.]|uniref:TetR-like C-terminal domain-containing protein n=1 Tax=Floccifex sp. TaxID=2815810 RepID=UPI003F064D04